MFFFIIQNVIAQPLPNMYVEKSESNTRIARFSNGRNSKYKRLLQLNGKQDMYFDYSNVAIKNLINKIGTENGLRLYFAKYDRLSVTKMPSSTEDKKVILIFSPGSLFSKPAAEQFYFIDDKDPSNPVININDVNAVARWIRNYEQECQQVLRPGLSPNDPDNRHPYKPGPYFDTESIFYSKASLEEAINKEETYPHTINGAAITISAYRVSFSSFGKNGKPAGPGHNRFKKRMQIEIDYMYTAASGNKVIFHFEDLDNFDQRSRETIKASLDSVNNKINTNYSSADIDRLSKTEIIKLLQSVLIDNGQLCPTSCPQ